MEASSVADEEPLERDFETARSRLERHTLMASVATRFISVPTDQISAAVEDAMSAIGRFAGVDRVALALFDDKYERWSIDHDWHSPGLWPLKGLVEHVAPFRWGLPQVIAGSPVEVLRPDYLPRLANNEALLLRGLGLGATLLIPVYRRGKVIGFAAVSTTRFRSTPWPRAVHELLELPAKMMVHALDRSVTEQRLRESQARWQSLCESNVVGVFTMGRSDGHIMESNEAGLALLGRSRSDLAAGGVLWSDVSPGQDDDSKMLAILDRTGRVLPWERHLVQPDGTDVPVLCSLASLAPQSDQVLAVAIDLRSRRRIAEELRRRDEIDRLHAELSRRLLSLTGESVETAVREALAIVANQFGFDGVVVFDVDPDAEMATRRAWWSRPEVRRVEPETSIALAGRAWWRERLRAGRTSFIGDVESLPENARGEREAMERFHLRAAISVPLLPGGVLRGMVLFYSARRMEVADDLLATLRVFGDIIANALERLRVDREIQDAVATLERRVEMRRRQLEASNAELEAFAYSVSHDLRAPLRTIDGMSQVMREDFASELGDDGVLLLRRIQSATQRMSHLIDGLLQLSRVVRTEMEWQEVSISDLAEGLVDELKRRHGGRDVQVRIAPDLVMTGHPRLLRIAFEQLLDNAFKFTGLRSDALIELDGRNDQNTITFFVRDNGVGFDPEFAEKLFGAFQRLHGAAEFEGHGIGLATVERVMRMHGGSAHARGTPDRGATIELTFPRVAASP
ncbi:MAG TPA: ATP-binding protein [Candidatus Binatia bacterium]